MNGIAFAVAAGIGFGLFQSVNRRANQGIDAYRATFGLLLIGTVGLAAASAASQGLGRLGAAPPSSLALFAAAGIVHFYFGWTLLTLSQQRVGAARTSAAAASTPAVGTVLAALLLGEPVTAMIGAGVVLVVGGLVVLSLRGSRPSPVYEGSVPWFGLGAAVTWGISPLFIRWGLEGFDSPLLGVTVGLAAATLAYGISLTVTRRWGGSGAIPRDNLVALVIAGIIVALAIFSQWMSYDLTSVAVAITLHQLAAPVVIVAAPIIVGRDLEPISPPIVIGAGLVMCGSISVVFG